MVKSKNEKALLQYYLVVFIDVLGQREALRAIKDLPTNVEDFDEFTDCIKGTLGKVVAVRKMFTKFFEGVNVNMPDINVALPERQDDFIDPSQLKMNSSCFSDSIIIRVPFADDGSGEYFIAMNGVLQALVATGSMGLLALSRKIVLRAGLDVGIGTIVDDNEIYGPVLERAYYLESQLAEYPRYLIGDELKRFLFQVSRQKCKSRYGKVAKKRAGFCIRMITQDTDGRLMLDFLGEAFVGRGDDPIKESTFTQALHFVTSQYEKFSGENNHKLSARYYRLMLYMKERRVLWVTS